MPKPDQAGSKAALKTYFPAMVRASSYPNLLTEDLPALAVKAYLVTYDYNMRGTRDYMARFARSLCQNFPVLQEKGPPKWCETEMSLPSLGRGWFYYPPTGQGTEGVRRGQDECQGASCTVAVQNAGANPGLV